MQARLLVVEPGNTLAATSVGPSGLASDARKTTPDIPIPRFSRIVRGPPRPLSQARIRSTAPPAPPCRSCPSGGSSPWGMWSRAAVNGGDDSPREHLGVIVPTSPFVSETTGGVEVESPEGSCHGKPLPNLECSQRRRPAPKKFRGIVSQDSAQNSPLCRKAVRVIGCSCLLHQHHSPLGGRTAAAADSNSAMILTPASSKAKRLPVSGRGSPAMPLFFL
jgi:hypothetical protein